MSQDLVMLLWLFAPLALIALSVYILLFLSPVPDLNPAQQALVQFADYTAKASVGAVIGAVGARLSLARVRPD